MRFGTLGQPPVDWIPDEDELRRRRLQAARSCSTWAELEASALVRRGRRFYVHADDDTIFVSYTGAVWNRPGGLEFSQMSPALLHAPGRR